jgi:hypothetical protein
MAVMPAKVGIHLRFLRQSNVDARFRGHDGNEGLRRLGNLIACRGKAQRQIATKTLRMVSRHSKAPLPGNHHRIRIKHIVPARLRKRHLCDLTLCIDNQMQHQAPHIMMTHTGKRDRGHGHRYGHPLNGVTTGSNWNSRYRCPSHSVMRLHTDGLMRRDRMNPMCNMLHGYAMRHRMMGCTNRHRFSTAPRLITQPLRPGNTHAKRKQTQRGGSAQSKHA